MFRKLFPLVLAVSMLAITGCRELVSPIGYAVIENILHPVRVQTKDLEGAGWLKAYLPNGQWEIIHLSPGGSFVYNDMLPPKVWHCDPANGADGCIAILQAGDEKGVLYDNTDLGRFYVCTENYVQKMGRVHCGTRHLEDLNTGEETHFDRHDTDFVNEQDALSGTQLWHGDALSMLVEGQSEPIPNTYNPPSEDGATSRFRVHTYKPGQTPEVNDPNKLLGLPTDVDMLSVDAGACHVFMPWVWDDAPDSVLTTIMGQKTGNMGLAELILDGIIATEKRWEYQPDVILYMDALVGITQRTDVSPEIHLQIDAPSPNGLQEMQLCVKNYMRASNDIHAGIDAWYRWDQGILTALGSLFNIGSCREHPVSMTYCGYVLEGAEGPTFVVDTTKTQANIEGYSWFKPACNNQFKPKLEDGLRQGANGLGAANMTDGLRQLTQGFEEAIGVKIRRLEMTPKGVYLVTANSIFDSQYGIGECHADIEEPGGRTAPLIGDHTQDYTNRGITLF